MSHGYDMAKANVASGLPLNELGYRMDGPTKEEFVAAGYAAENYPPLGYAAK